MESRNIHLEKLSIIQWLSQIEDISIVERISEIRIYAEQSRSKSISLEKKRFSPMSFEKFNAEIDSSMMDSKNNKVTKAKDLKSKY